MSKWTIYQLLIVMFFAILFTLNNLFKENVLALFSFIDSFISPSILVVFFSVILVIWGFSFILLLQEKKRSELFVHKIWRIMPAIVGVLLVLSIVVFLVLFLTVLSNVNPTMHWMLDLILIYLLVLFYMFVLSLFIRYGKSDTTKGKVITSANTAVLILIFVIFFLPTI